MAENNNKEEPIEMPRRNPRCAASKVDAGGDTAIGGEIW